MKKGEHKKKVWALNHTDLKCLCNILNEAGNMPEGASLFCIFTEIKDSVYWTDNLAEIKVEE